MIRLRTTCREEGGRKGSGGSWRRKKGGLARRGRGEEVQELLIFFNSGGGGGFTLNRGGGSTSCEGGGGGGLQGWVLREKIAFEFAGLRRKGEEKMREAFKSYIPSRGRGEEQFAVVAPIVGQAVFSCN